MGRSRTSLSGPGESGGIYIFHHPPFGYGGPAAEGKTGVLLKATRQAACVLEARSNRPAPQSRRAWTNRAFGNTPEAAKGAPSPPKKFLNLKNFFLFFLFYLLNSLGCFFFCIILYRFIYIGKSERKFTENCPSSNRQIGCDSRCDPLFPICT